MEAGSESAPAQCPDAIRHPGDTDIVCASEPKHPVQGNCGDGNRGRLGLVGARSKCIADHTFVPTNRCVEAHDLVGADELLPDMEADVLIADKAFDANERVIEPLATAGKTAVIPPKANRGLPRKFDRRL
jgi:hypothetical protein